MGQPVPNTSKPSLWRELAFDSLLQFAIYPNGILACMVCFALFDRLHITQTWLQIAVVLSPLLVWAFFLWRRK